VVASSPHRDEYVRLLEAGWSSLALERYALHRYREDIPASTFRAYKAKKKIVVKGSGLGADPEQMVDILAQRADLIRMQRERIDIDLTHERNMGKLFSTTRSEIQLLDTLLNSHKADLQDVGVMPREGESLTINVPQPSAEAAPRAKSLGEAFGVEPGQESELARVLHLRMVASDGARVTESG